jgi:hypothetical protein
MSTPEVADKYLPRKEAAAYIGERIRGRPYAEITLKSWERDGYGPPPTRIGRNISYFMPSIEKWLKAQERTARGTTNAHAA